MIVEAVQRHRAGGVVREIGAVFHVSPETGKHLARCGLARVVDQAERWDAHYGRELRAEPLVDQPWPKVVACLNIWNDRPALEQTLPTWASHVDAVVVADGPYRTVPNGEGRVESEDGLSRYLHSFFVLPSRFDLITSHEAWPDQNKKRTTMLRFAAQKFPDALLFIVDADEYVTGAEHLHQTPQGDVAWLTVTSPLYQRPYGQPRLVRAQPGLEYRGRHHWLYAGERLLATHQYGGAGVEHRLSPITLRNARGLGHTPARAQAKQVHALVQRGAEQAAATPQGARSDRAIGAREALRIAACTTYDPGLVGYRLHTAINTTTPHCNAFFRRGLDNPFQGPRQYDVDADPALTARLLAEADVVHCHLDYTVPDSLKVKPKALVIHHHGTMFRSRPGPDLYNMLDHLRAALRLVSNLELLRYGQDLHWLPNPVSVARLRRLRAQEYRETGVYRVAHSPSKRALKGTDDFLAAVAQLQQRGLAIEAVLIEGVSISESLRIKATCDACFDSFWLGIQCSGVEAGAMGLPVIAGDPQVRERYQEHVGHVPYTYANDGDELTAALERLATDTAWATDEAARVATYVEDWHDDAAVALRYLDLLDDAIGWRAAKTVGAAPVAKPRRQKAVVG
jgi:hypothetical protein